MGKGEHKAPEYIQEFHPFGKVPALTDGPVQIFESKAICRYLMAKYASAGSSLLLFAGSADNLAIFEQAASVEYSYFEPSISRLAYEKLFKRRMMGHGEPDAAAVNSLKFTFEQALDYYDKVLQKRTYLTGNQNQPQSPTGPGASRDQTQGPEASDLVRVESILFGNPLSTSQQQLYWPEPVQAFQLWQIYIDNVNPISNLLHVPTTQRLLLEATGAGQENLISQTKAILSAVYLTAVESLDNATCLQLMNTSQDQLLGKLFITTQQSLLDADLMAKSDYGLLQAFVLYLIHLLNRHYTNLCDGVDNTDTAHITPFDTKRPLNLNDADLHPNMTISPPERQGITEMAFCSVRYEIGDFVRQLSSENWSQQDKVLRIQDLEKTLEYKLSLVHCHALVTSDENTSAESKAQIFTTALLLLQTQNASCSNAMLDRYRWHTKLFYCFEALFPVLRGLAFDNLDETSETEAWKQVSLAYQCNPELLPGKVSASYNSLRSSLSKLASKAWSRRSKEDSSTASMPPNFVDIMSSQPALPTSAELHSGSIPVWQPDSSLQESLGLEPLQDAMVMDSLSDQQFLADDSQAWEHWLNLLDNDALLDF
ncbi:hypothetical protein E4T39_08202 [Aureobasidium subglaciale]|nr:hypothetical protein E4T39_08202 [Aureobasidium subglaciale]